jgi:hypothetical protein
MSYEPPTDTDKEILADLEDKAAHWELEATLNPDTPEIAAVCLDYAKHIRTMAECLRMDMLERDNRALGPRSIN